MFMITKLSSGSLLIIWKAENYPACKMCKTLKYSYLIPKNIEVVSIIALILLMRKLDREIK